MLNIPQIPLRRALPLAAAILAVTSVFALALNPRTILTNGTIYTPDGLAEATSVVVEDGIITFIGSEQEAREQARWFTEEIDLRQAEAAARGLITGLTVCLVMLKSSLCLSADWPGGSSAQSGCDRNIVNVSYC